MIRGILIAVLVICFAVGGWALWKQYNGSSAFGSGDVKPREVAAQKDRTDAAFTDLDGNPKATTTFDTGAQDSEGSVTASAQAPMDRTAVPSPGSGTVVTGQTPIPQDQAPAAAPAPPAPSVAASVTAAAAAVKAAVIGGTQGPALPVSDTIAPNPPNGAIFAGTGKFQWYRQGNITWRVNSGNGAACIAFATMEEWQKQIVYAHGCGNA